MQITINRKTGVLAPATAGILATVGVGWAAIPGDDGQIKGCYATTSGLLGIAHSKGDTRVVDSAEACRSYEKPLSCNQQGPKGDRGPQGPQGGYGADGAPCPPAEAACVGPKGDSGVVDIKTSSGSLTQPPGDEGYPTTFAFARPAQLVTVAERQAVLGVSSMSIRIPVDNRQLGLRYAICSRTDAAGALRTWGELFSWYGDPSQNNSMTTHALLALTPGRYEIGPCVAAEHANLFDFAGSTSSTSLLLVDGG